jgi:hypothetical protein
VGDGRAHSIDKLLPVCAGSDQMPYGLYEQHDEVSLDEI